MKKITAFLLALVMITSFVACSKTKQSEESNQIPEDVASYSPQEVYEYLISNDISFSYNTGDFDAKYCVVQEYNNGNFVTYQYCSHPILGDWYVFNDDSINDESVEFGNDQDETPETLEQAEAYEKWLEKYGISETQLNAAIEYYCSITEPKKLSD